VAVYRRVYDSRHLQAHCQEPGSAPEPDARQSSMGYVCLLLTYSLAHSQKESYEPSDEPVRGENESFAAVSHLCQRVPQQAPCHWVDPSRRLVQKDDRRVADQSNASTQLPLVATAEYNQAIGAAPRWVTLSTQDCEPRMRHVVSPIRGSAKVLSHDVVHKTGST